MLPTPLAFVDIETTGMRTLYDRIIEIGILRIENNTLTKTFKSLINPQTYLPQEIERLTGIAAPELENAPTFRQIAKDILEVLDGCIFVAHNVRFDYSFLKSEFRRENISFTAKHLCTVKLSRSLFPTLHHHNLDAIIEHFHIPCPNRHRAFDDASALYTFYQKLQQEIDVPTLKNAIDLALKKPSIPAKLDPAVLDTIPELPGVYLFYGKDGTPLYIGKSKNIKERVLSHFSGDLRSGTEMKISQQIESIETIPTAGELGALLLESHLIKKMLPIYNKMLRNKKELIAIKSKQDDKGYQTITLETIQQIDTTELNTFLGFFKSRKRAKDFLVKIAKEYSLCEKLLGLENTKSSCFAYRLESCKGACIGEEKPLFYNLRHTAAFSKSKILPWPFPGPIVIEEKNSFDDTTDFFVLDKWCYLGNIKFDTSGNCKNNLENDFTFDLDIYNILKRYLRNRDHIKNIRLVSQTELSKYINLPHLT